MDSSTFNLMVTPHEIFRVIKFLFLNNNIFYIFINIFYNLAHVSLTL